jgi:hypothetical protein
VDSWPITWSVNLAAKKIECFICREPVAESYLDHHIWVYHVDGTLCWCGVDLLDRSREAGGSPQQFKSHCVLHGGYLSHYLECQLGVDRDV